MNNTGVKDDLDLSILNSLDWEHTEPCEVCLMNELGDREADHQIHLVIKCSCPQDYWVYICEMHKQLVSKSEKRWTCGVCKEKIGALKDWIVEVRPARSGGG